MSSTSLLPMVGHALWNAAQNVTGIAGVTPLQVLYGIAGIVAVIFIVGIVQAIRGKTAFSLEARDSEWNES